MEKLIDMISLSHLKKMRSRWAYYPFYIAFWTLIAALVVITAETGDPALALRGFLVLAIIWTIMSFMLLKMNERSEYLRQTKTADEKEKEIIALINDFLDDTLCKKSKRQRFISQIFSISSGNPQIAPIPIELKEKVEKEELGYYTYEVYDRLRGKINQEVIAEIFYKTLGKNLSCDTGESTFSKTLKTYHTDYSKQSEKVKKSTPKRE